MSVHEARAAGAFPAEFWARHKKGLIIATIAAPVMAMLGALGTDQIGFWPRLLYWLILMESGALIGFGVSTAVDLWGRFRGRPWIEGALISVAIAAPLTLIVIAVSGMFFGTRIPGLSGFLWMFGIVVVVSGVITALNYALHPRAMAAVPLPPSISPQPSGNAPPPSAKPQSPRLLDRLPPPHRNGPVLALEAEDHYLRVHTPAGSTLILMRLSDAIAELDGADGAQTHRSWWVARAAVASVTRSEGRATLSLDAGIAAPVSRTHYRNLRDAGWF